MTEQNAPRSDAQRAVITGYGAITPIGNSAASYSSGSFSGARSATSPIVAVTILFKIGIVGMGRAKSVCDVFVVFALLVCIRNQDADRCACRFSFKNPREEFNFIFFATLGSDFGLPGLSALHVKLDFF